MLVSFFCRLIEKVCREKLQAYDWMHRLNSDGRQVKVYGTFNFLFFIYDTFLLQEKEIRRICSHHAIRAFLQISAHIF